MGILLYKKKAKARHNPKIWIRAKILNAVYPVNDVLGEFRDMAFIFPQSLCCFLEIISSTHKLFLVSII